MATEEVSSSSGVANMGVTKYRNLSNLVDALQPKEASPTRASIVSAISLFGGPAEGPSAESIAARKRQVYKHQEQLVNKRDYLCKQVKVKSLNLLVVV